MIDRRTLMGAAGATLAIGALPRLAAAKSIARIGLQLYTVRDIFEKDPAGTLGKVARIGYKEVEYGGGGYDKMDAAMLRRTMDRLGLRCPSIHVGYDLLLGDMAGTIARAKTLGADTVVLPYMTEQYRTEAGWTAALPNFTRFAEGLANAGLGFAYHNHDFEFTTKPDGVSLYDRFLTATDPKLVKVELDLFWAIRAGEDAGALIDRLSPRLYAYHVKDMRADKSMTAVGAGTIDFAALFRRPSSAGVRHFYVENDQAPAPYLPDITTSFKTLRALRY
ncbi:sugar phosphate isomerase/epimerase [Sphingomonas sp. Y38-1Y]|uniref:sugar phosphate isomerase/epimerase family protein n=1 Tax=Sphingomonas sp. Y38-1Y TaxID=3078265 RepID=UPI0028EFE12A|nr:sugar phosphate isomerase/epimerase [Sphingomonas sp. Y38-1Y]